jgi:ribosomal protein S18 acetylase RimI-like enzyme
VDRAKEAGSSAVELHVLELNRARGLYERLGFEVVGEEPPKIRMRLGL